MDHKVNEKMAAVLEFLGNRNPLTLDDAEMAKLVDHVCKGVAPPQRLSFASFLAESYHEIDDPYARLVAAKFVQGICRVEAAAIDVMLATVAAMQPHFFKEIEADRE